MSINDHQVQREFAEDFGMRRRPVDPEPRVTVEVSLTPAEYESIKTNASRDGVTSVSEYLRLKALGWEKRGC
jgi:hypothetical protein